MRNTVSKFISAWVLVLITTTEPVMADTKNLLLDDFNSANGRSSLGTFWRGFTDRVMGGISDLSARYSETDQGAAIRMTGSVRLENNGGFIQLRLPLNASNTALDISGFDALQLIARGQPGAYYIHLRTQDNRRPWHYYAAAVEVTPDWQTVTLPLDEFQPRGTRQPLDLTRALSIAIVAYGERFEADIEVAQMTLIGAEVEDH